MTIPIYRRSDATARAWRSWMALATTAEQEQLADLIGSSRASLYQLSGPTPLRRASAGMAAKIEAATLLMHDMTGGRLPIVYRSDMCADCANCPFAREALGDVRDFEVLKEK